MSKYCVLKNVTSRHRERTCRDFVAEESFTRSGQYRRLRTVISMRKNFQSICRILALGVVMSTASKADEMYPQSFVNVHANASSIGTYDNYGHYNNYDGFYTNYNSSSAQGGGGGAALRFVIPGGFMFDASYNTDQANRSQGDLRINQGTAGLGYRGVTWYAEAMFTTFQPRVTSNYLCGGPCASVTYNGGGIKGGWVWTFARQWYATVDTGIAGLQGPSGTHTIVQGIFGGSVGYKFSPNFSLDLALLSNAWVFGNSSHSNYNNTFSVTSIQAGASLHF
jgi:hypothetical protein